jgi:cytochrome c
MLRAFAILALLAGAAQAETPVARGERLANEYCGACHAIGRTGESPRPEAPAFRDLHRRYPVEQLAESLAEGIVTGHNDMPEISFPAPDVDALIAWLRTLER